MIWLLIVVVFAACAYQLVAITAVLRQLFAGGAGSEFRPPVSVLKPVHGVDPRFDEAIRSHAAQDYPEFELLFGVNDPADPAIPYIKRLQAGFPSRRIELIVSRAAAGNPKVGVLADLARAARHPVWLVNDGDIRVPPDYLGRVAAPLADPMVGLVTCLYRARPETAPAWWEALGIAVDFAPSTLVAPLVGVREFGLGATLVFRAADWDEMGGFEEIRDYLADDYQLAKRLTTGLNRRAAMSEVIVDTGISYPNWHSLWKHQVRWARTIRVSRPGGYLGLPLTQAGLWAAVALAFGHPTLAFPLLAVRILMAAASGILLERSPVAAAGFLLAPLWDVWAFAVWLAGLAGREVEWRGERFRLTPGGKLERPTA